MEKFLDQGFVLRWCRC